MKITARLSTTCAISAILALPLAAASVPSSKPEEVGLSAERLHRIHETVQRHIDAHDISGAVTIVARNGHLAHLEAHGLMDLDSKKAMTPGGLFWIASNCATSLRACSTFPLRAAPIARAV